MGCAPTMQALFSWAGACPLASRLVSSSHPWIRPLLAAMDAAHRGLAQVVFANNPISGILVVLGLTAASPAAGLAGIACSLAALLVAAYCRLPADTVQSGLTQFNGVLVGTVVLSLWPGELTARVWAAVLLGAALTVVVHRAVGGFLAGVKAPHHTGTQEVVEVGVPGFTLPFNLVGWVVWGVLLRTEVLEVVEQEVVEEEGVDWARVCLGSVYSMGQVYGVHSLACSAIIYLAVTIYSPTIALAQWLGALIGSLLATLLGAPYSSIYMGVWGYSPLLTAGAMVLFTKPTLRSLPLHLLAVTFTVLVHSFLSPILLTFHLPTFTIPFVLATWAFLLLSTGEGVVEREVTPVTPEHTLLTTCTCTSEFHSDTPIAETEIV